MKIILEIPKEFETEFKIDRFEDSLERLLADAHLIAGNYEQEVAKMLIYAFSDAETDNFIPVSLIRQNIPFQSMSVGVALSSMLDSWESKNGNDKVER